MAATEALSTHDANTPTPPSLDDGTLKEPIEMASVKGAGSEDCPDGGLRAWLVVFGVRCGCRCIVDGSDVDLVLTSSLNA